MTATELAKYVGKSAQFRAKTMLFDVKIEDARCNWGKVDVFIRPVSGTGEAWVSEESVRIPESAS